MPASGQLVGTTDQDGLAVFTTPLTAHTVTVLHPDYDLVSLVDANEAQIEAQGVPLASYTAPGSEHTVLWRDLVYEIEVGGVRLIDWIADVAAGEPVADVHCVDCR